MCLWPLDILLTLKGWAVLEMWLGRSWTGCCAAVAAGVEVEWVGWKWSGSVVGRGEDLVRCGWML